MVKLKRDLSLILLILYGIGTIVGAGIYVLVGKVIDVSGYYAPLSFIVSGIIASFSALSYARLSTYMPDAGGEFAYVSSAFNWKYLYCFVAVLVMFTGIISAATVARGFIGYFQIFFDVSSTVILSSFIVAVGLISMLKIKQSVKFIALFAILEICGLLFVIFVLRGSFTKLPEFIPMMVPSDILDIQNWNIVFMGAFLAFFAFIGFEDMVNVAEEVKKPKINMPLGIVFALICTVIIYTMISLSATLSLPPEVLGKSDAPMAELIKIAGYSPKVISAISLFSIFNGAVVQIIMASRVLFSMGRQSLAPGFCAHVSSVTGTPINSTILVIFVIAVFAFLFPIEYLAQFTSAIILVVFSIMNLSLIIIEGRREKKKGFIIIAVIGFVLSVMLLSIEALNYIRS